MDINCTDRCIYQIDGKCCMEQVPIITETAGHVAMSRGDSDCPYIRQE